MSSLAEHPSFGPLPAGDTPESLPVRSFSSSKEDNTTWFGQVWKEIRLGNGLVLTVFDAIPPQGFSLEFSKSNSLIDFGFFLEGSFVNKYDTRTRRGLELCNRAGQFGVGYSPEMCGSVHFPAERKLRIMHVHVLPSTLSGMLGRDVDRVPPCLLKVLDAGRPDGFVHQNRQSPLMQTVANELFYSAKNDAAIRLYIEGKVYELLALALTGSSSVGPETLLCPKLRDTLFGIREELEECHCAPPTLSEISAKYLLPIATIQAGFKTLFNMSVFAFVKEYRLQRARKLFAEGDLNVSEVAWDIGYTNLSHFSSAYKKRFGVLPKAYLQSVRENLHTPPKLVP